MQITSKGDEITRIDIQGFSPDWKLRSLRLSDIHIDSPYCDRKLLKRHLDAALQDNAPVFINGDFFDAMQGPQDPRRSYRELKDYLKGNDYFDRVLQDGFEFMLPYKNILAMIGYGNHEYSVVRHNGTDLVQRLVALLRKEGSKVVAGGYGGWIRYSVYDNTINTPRDTYWVRYNHGSGGDAPVTKGMIGVNRQAVFLQGVNEVWNGHNHNDYITHISTLRPNNKDVIEQGLTTYIRTPGYKNEYQDTAHGFAVSRNMQPTPRGAVWCEMRRADRKIIASYTADVI